MKKAATIPFTFVLERLDSVRPVVRPMFGCYAIYIGRKMVLILRNREDHAYDNGVWLATARQHHEELRKLFPSMRSVRLLGTKTTAWQNLPVDADDFECAAIKACEMILRNDQRIGKIPKPKKKRSGG